MSLVVVDKVSYSFSFVMKAANEKLSDLKSKMIEYAKDHAKDIKEGLEVLPGVESLLQALSSRDNVFIGLASLLIDTLFLHILHNFIYLFFFTLKLFSKYVFSYVILKFMLEYSGWSFGLGVLCLHLNIKHGPEHRLFDLTTRSI